MKEEKNKLKLYKNVSNCTDIKENIKSIISDTFKSYKPKNTYNDCILEQMIKNNSEFFEKVHKLKFIQMSIGKIWQQVIGLLPHLIDVGNGHESGLDIITNKHSEIQFCMELKNAYNTDNASSKKANYDKLIKYSLTHNCDAIYGIINCNSKDGKDKIIKHNNVNIRYLSGLKLLDFIFESNYIKIINLISKYVNREINI